MFIYLYSNYVLILYYKNKNIQYTKIKRVLNVLRQLFKEKNSKFCIRYPSQRTSFKYDYYIRFELVKINALTT